jgi:hypothetical protein
VIFDAEYTKKMNGVLNKIIGAYLRPGTFREEKNMELTINELNILSVATTRMVLVEDLGLLSL